MEQCDILFGTEGEYDKALGIQFPKFEAQDAAYRLDAAGYEAAAVAVSARFPNCRAVVFALRNELSANHHLISGMISLILSRQSPLLCPRDKVHCFSSKIS